MQPYFEAAKTIAFGSVPYKNGRAKLDYVVRLRWENILTSAVRCGAKESYKITRRIGVSREEKQTTQAAITSTLGVEAIAKFEGRLAAENSITVRWEWEEQTEHNFEVTAPECKEYLAVRYQLIRDFQLRYTETGWIRSKGWQKRFTERLPNFHDASHINDAECGCAKSADVMIEAEYEAIHDSFSFIVGALPGVEGTWQLLLPGGRAVVMPHHDKAFRIRVSNAYIAPDLLFLASVAHETLDLVLVYANARTLRSPVPMEIERVELAVMAASEPLTEILSITPDEKTVPRYRIPELATV